MKKLFAAVLVFLMLVPALFADDAKVMPARVGRVYVAPTFTLIPGAYDEDGKYKSNADDEIAKAFNLGFAAEYGVIDWITAAVQWAPGWTVWSDIEPMSGYKDSNTNGVADLFVGAKIQIVGENAPVKNSMFRAAVAPGVIIPLPGPDFEEEATNASKGDEATLSSMDRHVFAAGGRFYFDYVINENFFINLYNETIIYPIAQDLNKDSPNFAMVKAGFAQTIPPVLPNPPIDSFTSEDVLKRLNAVGGEVNYGYRLTFELEPVFTMPLAEGLSFSAGLPVNYVYKPAYEYSFSGLASLAEYTEILTGGVQDEKALEKLLLDNLNTDPSHLLSIKPNVSLFLTSTPLPLEFKLQYQLPVWGQSTTAGHNMTLQIKAYFRI